VVAVCFLSNIITRLEGLPSWFIAFLLFALLIAAALLAMIIGYFIGLPFQDLHQKIELYRAGDDSITFEPTGSVAEVDELSVQFGDLLTSAGAQRSDLLRQQSQQGQLIGDVAHELRTPLTAIHGNAELLMDPDMPQEMREKFTQGIIDESERLTRITNDLLSLQRFEGDDKSTEFERLNLKPLVEQAVEYLEPVLQERQVKVTISGEAPDVLGNADRLTEVISNLIDNASRFAEQPDALVEVDIHGVNDMSVVAVSDNGPGFGDTDPALLFERFYRTEFSRARDKGGSGLGLSIVKTIVEAHDGTVEAFNRPEGGACFIVAIPSVAAQ